MWTTTAGTKAIAVRFSLKSGEHKTYRTSIVTPISLDLNDVAYAVACAACSIVQCYRGEEVWVTHAEAIDLPGVDDASNQ